MTFLLPCQCKSKMTQLAFFPHTVKVNGDYGCHGKFKAGFE